MTAAVSLHPDLALIFDMDGVLIHSTPVHNEAWRDYLRLHGKDEALTSIEAKMLGKHNADIVRIFFGEGMPEDSVARHGAEKERIFRRLMAPRLAEQLVPGVIDFIREMSHVPMAVATNAEAENLDFVLKGGGIRRFFRVIVDGHQVVRPKPDPEIYVKTAGLLGKRPGECVVFEDSATGIRAARAAGTHVVGVTTTTQDLADCDLLIPDFLDSRLRMWLGSVRPVLG